MYNPNGIAICVLADSPIKTARDLNGKTVAVTTLADQNTVAIKAWLDQNGGDSTTVQFLEIPFSAMRAAMQRGTIAAAPISEPTLSIAKNEGGIRVLLPHLLDVFGSTFLVGGWFARTEWLRNNTPTARRFASAIYASARWANAHPDESADILAKAAKLDPAVVRGMNRAPYGYSLTPAMFQTQLDLAYKYKVLDRSVKGSEIFFKT